MHLAAEQPGIELATFRSLIRCPTATPPSHTSHHVDMLLEKNTPFKVNYFRCNVSHPCPHSVTICSSVLAPSLSQQRHANPAAAAATAAAAVTSWPHLAESMHCCSSSLHGRCRIALRPIIMSSIQRRPKQWRTHCGCRGCPDIPKIQVGGGSPTPQKS